MDSEPTPSKIHTQTIFLQKIRSRRRRKIQKIRLPGERKKEGVSSYGVKYKEQPRDSQSLRASSFPKARFSRVRRKNDAGIRKNWIPTGVDKPPCINIPGFRVPDYHTRELSITPRRLRVITFSGEFIITSRRGEGRGGIPTEFFVTENLLRSRN